MYSTFVFLLIHSIHSIQYTDEISTDDVSFDATQSTTSNTSVSRCDFDHHPMNPMVITTEKEMYKLIGSVCENLFNLSDTRRCPLGPVIVPLGGFPLHLFNVTEQMQRNPISIASAVVNIMKRWYEWFSNVHSMNNKITPFECRHNLIFYLGARLRTFQELYDMNSFQILSKSLDSLDSHYKHFTQSRVPLIPRWLLHDEYVAIISDQKLRIIGILGEGTQAFVFKVQSQVDKQVYALKLFKRMYEGLEGSLEHSRRECKSEENILMKITEIVESEQNLTVPQLIARTNDDITIDCERHQAFLMELIESEPTASSLVTGVINAMTMYSQLSFNIDVLARNGISHNDINEENVVFDSYGRYWLIDFGLASMDLNHRPIDSEEEYHYPILGAFFYYSPQMWRMNEMLGDKTLYDLSVSEKRDLILESNLYSLRSLILHNACKSVDLYRGELKQMQALHVQMDMIWRRDNLKGWSFIKKNLMILWEIRSLMASKYIRRRPQSPFIEVFEPLVLKHSMMNSIGHVDIAVEFKDSRIQTLDRKQSGCCDRCVVN